MAVNEIFHVGRGVTYIKNHRNSRKSTAYITRRNPDNVKIKTIDDLGNFVENNPRGSFRNIPILKSEGKMWGNENAFAVDHFKYTSPGRGTTSSDVGQNLKMSVASGHTTIGWIADPETTTVLAEPPKGSRLAYGPSTTRVLGYSIMKFPFRTFRSMDAWDHRFGMINDDTVEILSPMGIATFQKGQLWSRQAEFNLYEDGTALVYEGFYVFWGLQGSWFVKQGTRYAQEFQEQNWWDYTASDEPGSEKSDPAWSYLAATAKFPRKIHAYNLGK